MTLSTPYIHLWILFSIMIFIVAHQRAAAAECSEVIKYEQTLTVRLNNGYVKIDQVTVV